MGMDNAPDVMSGGMNSAMDHITSLRDAVGQVRLLYDGALKINRVEIRGTDFTVMKPQSINEKEFLITWHLSCDVVVDNIGHAVLHHQPITGSQINFCGIFNICVQFDDSKNQSLLYRTSSFVSYRIVESALKAPVTNP